MADDLIHGGASTYDQGPHLKPGYRGTEYQILTLLVKLLASLNKDRNTYALMEVANTGILDDIVLVTCDDDKKPTSVKALQVKYYQHPIGESLLKPGAKIGIDECFIGYLALKAQYPQATLVTMLYTNTTLADNVSKEVKKGYCVLSEESWARSCRIEARDHKVSIPKSFFSEDRFFNPYTGAGTNSPLKESQLKQLVDKFKIDPSSGFPQLINEQYEIVGDIGKVTVEQWGKVRKHYKKNILRPNKEPSLSSAAFVAHIKSAFKKKQSYNKNLAEALRQYKKKSRKKQKEIAEAFLSEFRLYTKRATFDQQYQRGLESLIAFKQKQKQKQNKEDQDQNISLQQKNEITFAYVLNEVRLWFLKEYVDNEVPHLNKEWIVEKINAIESDETFWKEVGVSQQLVTHIYDTINKQKVERKKPQADIEAAIASSDNVIMLHGAAGSGKSVLAKYYWQQWGGTKFFIDIHQTDSEVRMDRILQLLESLPRTLIIIDRGERIVDTACWAQRLQSCRSEHQVLFVTREKVQKKFIKPDRYIESPEFSSDEILDIKLPAFITNNSTLTKLCRLPFFCRLAFDVDSPLSTTMNKQAFIKFAIEGVYSQESVKEKNRVLWHALCLDMVKSQQNGHSPIQPSARLKAMSSFAALIKREILIGDLYTEKVSFVHDIFFEVGIESLLTFSLEYDFVNNQVSSFGAKLSLYFTHLPQYNINLLLPWLHQHSQKIEQLHNNPEAFSLLDSSDHQKKAVLALLMKDKSKLSSEVKPDETIGSMFGGKTISCIALSLFFKNIDAFEFLSRKIESITEQTLKDCFDSFYWWENSTAENELQFLRKLMSWINNIWLVHCKESENISSSIFKKGIEILSTNLISFDFLCGHQQDLDWIDGNYPVTCEQLIEDNAFQNIQLYHRSLKENSKELLCSLFEETVYKSIGNPFEPLADLIMPLMKIIKEQEPLICLTEQDIVECLQKSDDVLQNCIEPNERNSVKNANFCHTAGLSDDSICALFRDEIKTDFEESKNPHDDSRYDDNIEFAFSYILREPWKLSLSAALDILYLDDEDFKWLYDNGYKDKLQEYFAVGKNTLKFFPDHQEDRQMLEEYHDFVFLCSGRYIKKNLKSILKELKELYATECHDLIAEHFGIQTSSNSDCSSDDESRQNSFFGGSSDSMSKTEAEDCSSFVEYCLNH